MAAAAEVSEVAEVAEEKCSPTKTFQQDSTCRFHTLSKMIIKSVFDPLLPMTPEDINALWKLYAFEKSNQTRRTFGLFRGKML